MFHYISFIYFMSPICLSLFHIFQAFFITLFYFPIYACTFVKSLQSCLTLWPYRVRHAPLVHGIFQARILEWVASDPPGDLLTQESNLHFLCLLHCQVGFLPLAPLGKAPYLWVLCNYFALCSSISLSLQRPLLFIENLVKNAKGVARAAKI